MNTMMRRALRSLSISFFCITVMQVTISISLGLTENQTDRLALLAFKSKIIHDPQGILNSWNDSRHFCEWLGISCGRKHRRVTILDLRSKGFFGSLSPYIGNLSFLREIHLSDSNIQGGIPQEVGYLLRLEVLALPNNSLVGEIPANLSRCSRLTVLALEHNKLEGKIPLEFVSLCNLKLIAIQYNNLTGGIPSFLGNFTSLEFISIPANPFGGNIPNSLGQLKKLKALETGRNNLSGIIPPSIYNLSSLVIFCLPENQLRGSLPPNLGLTLARLKIFEISNNFFGGAIPVSLSNASELRLIQMNNNGFSGKLSVDFGGMQHLKSLILHANNLGSGEVDELSFVNSLANCSNLSMFIVSENQFKGRLPHSIANLSTKLQHLYADHNQFYGTIPSGMGNLISLEFLCMESNQLSGKIPKELGKLQSLNYMALFHNKLTGEIPSSLGNLSALGELRLNDNKLSGVIPSSIGSLKLTILNLSQNELSGTIPKQIFDMKSLSILLNLAQNQLVGSIPQNIKNLKALSAFVVSNNKLSGEIPNELGLFCSSLEYLHMDGNFFHGFIPSSLSSLRGIRDIDLSRNKFFGQIPKFLETLPLEHLNLSFNDLEGQVPTKGIFANASAISVVGNSGRLCGGIVDLQLPECNNEIKKEKMSRWSKILISIASIFSGLAMMSFFISCWLRKRKGQQPSEFGSILIKEINVSYESLFHATDGFSSTKLIGVGSFGSVYKGILDQDETVVAVKVLDLQRQGASKSFVAECKALRNIRHRNLVRVITSCSSIDFHGNDFKAIVYEYMSNGSLEKWLHPALETEEEQTKFQDLSLVQRISIAIDVASAIDYLHHQCHEPILHCDLKPSNVLLDNDMTAHVGDFGLASFLPKVSNSNQSSSVGVRGTIGYAAPEYGLGSEVSTTGDIYSYGILLLEMVTGKRPTDLMFEGGFNLHNFAKMALPDRVMDIVDPVLLNDDDNEVAVTNHRPKEIRNNNRKECLISMIRIGVACSMESPKDRINITNVVHELQLVRNILLQRTTVSMVKEG